VSAPEGDSMGTRAMGIGIGFASGWRAFDVAMGSVGRPGGRKWGRAVAMLGVFAMAAAPIHAAYDASAFPSAPFLPNSKLRISCLR